MKLKQLIPVLALLAMVSSVDAITKKTKGKIAKCSKNQKTEEIYILNNTGEDVDITGRVMFSGTNVLGKDAKSVPSPRGNVVISNVPQGKTVTIATDKAIYAPKIKTKERQAVISSAMKKVESKCITSVYVKPAEAAGKGQNVWQASSFRGQTNFELVKEKRAFVLKPVAEMHALSAQ